MERIIWNEHNYRVHYDAGIREGYPKCCVEQFSRECAQGVFGVAVHRCETHGIKFGKYRFEYLRCDACMRKWIKRYNIRTTK
jgi:hypothetical protein